MITLENESRIDLHDLRARSTKFRMRSFRSDVFPVVDTYEGVVSDPASLHKYLYANGDPANMVDPSGHISLGETLAVAGITGVLMATLLPSVRGVINSAYHVTASATRESLFTALFKGELTFEDWRRVGSGLYKGAEAGWVNTLDTLTFRKVDAIHSYRNQTWRAEGLDDSWVGTATNAFAWGGTAALYTAAAVWTWAAAGGGTMDVAVARIPAPWYMHIKYGVNGLWEHAWITTGSGVMEILPTAAPTASYWAVSGIPVLYPQAVMMGASGAATAYNCLTAMLNAVKRGWGG